VLLVVHTADVSEDTATKLTMVVFSSVDQTFRFMPLISFPVARLYVIQLSSQNGVHSCTVTMWRSPISVRACSCCGGVKTVEHFCGKDHHCRVCRLRYNPDGTRKHPDRRYLINWRHRNKTWFEMYGRRG